MKDFNILKASFKKRKTMQFCFVLLFTVQSVLSQQTKKAPVTSKDYHLWGKLVNEKISQYGRWVSFTMDYDEHPDTLFVKNTISEIVYKFPKGKNGKFNKESEFAILMPGEGIKLINLKNGKHQMIPDVTSFSFSSNGKYLLTQSSTKIEKLLDIRHADGTIIKSFHGAAKYTANPEGSSIIFSTSIEGKSSLILIDLSHSIEEKIILGDLKGKFNNMAWQSTGQSFAVLFQPDAETAEKSNTIYHYQIKEKKIYQLQDKKLADFKPDYRITEGFDSKLAIADDGSKIFFGLINKTSSEKYGNDKVQIWNGNDKLLYPLRKKNLDFEIESKLAVWWPKENRLHQISDDQHPYVFLSGDQHYAITFNPAELALQDMEFPNTNFYLTDLENGKTKLWLKNQTVAMGSFSISPGGKYVAYFKEKNWWAYSFSNDVHINLTKDKITELYSDEFPEHHPIGIEGWTAGDKSVIVQDRFNLWQVDIGSLNCRKIIEGRDRNIKYRAKRFGYDTNTIQNLHGTTSLTIDLNSLLIEASTKKGNGYFLLNKNNNLQTVADNKGFLSNLNKAELKDIYLYKNEDFDRPPSLTICNLAAETQKTIFKSNLQHYDFLWGKSESVEYTNSRNKKLDAVLYYPAGYDASKKYPMIVHIYQTFPKLLHQYINPSLYLYDAYNPANLTAKGYFVLVPDIDYELGNTGPSALDCTVSAANEIIRQGLVYPEKIGLIGHSFGGYESNYIITQTNFFAAAVSGAGIGDFTGHYFSIGWNWGTSEMWRYEKQQNRMGKSFFEDMGAYDRNSPVRYADKANTPILLWAGEQDKQIHYYQSIAFYLALQKNRKKEIMLIYPEEAHVPMKGKNQIDLTQRTEQWFDHYLKGEKFDWITQGTN